MLMSSHKNKIIRERLEKIYGKGCMFQRAYIAERIEQIGGIKTYKQYIQEHKYTLKKIKQLESTMTLHHLKHRSEGGATSEHNGAEINALAHAYTHSLPREQEEIINNMLRDFKFRVSTISLGDSVEVEAKEMEFDLSDCIEIPLEPVKKKEKFNRAKTKQQTRKKLKNGRTNDKNAKSIRIICRNRSLQ